MGRPTPLLGQDRIKSTLNGHKHLSIYASTEQDWPPGHWSPLCPVYDPLDILVDPNSRAFNPLQIMSRITCHHPIWTILRWDLSIGSTNQNSRTRTPHPYILARGYGTLPSAPISCRVCLCNSSLSDGRLAATDDHVLPLSTDRWLSCDMISDFEPLSPEVVVIIAWCHLSCLTNPQIVTIDIFVAVIEQWQNHCLSWTEELE